MSDIAAAIFAFDEAEHFAGAAGAAPAQRRTALQRFGIPAAALVVGTALATAPGYFSATPTDPSELRLQIVTPPQDALGLASFALSPDGRQIAFVAFYEERPHLWLRDLSSDVVRVMPGTGGAAFPFWF